LPEDEVRRAIPFTRRKFLTVSGAAAALAFTTGLPSADTAMAPAGAVRADPLRESPYRLAIEVHLAEGNVAEALSTYQNYRRLLAREIGVDEVRFKTAQVYDYKNDPNQLIPENGKYSRYRKDRKGEYEIRNTLENHCWRLWHATVITWDGLVVPCCFDKDAQHQLGDLKGKPFKEIWNNDQYVDFRRKVLQSRKNIDICANCSEGTRVWED